MRTIAWRLFSVWFDHLTEMAFIANSPSSSHTFLFGAMITILYILSVTSFLVLFKEEGLCKAFDFIHLCIVKVVTRESSLFLNDRLWSNNDGIFINFSSFSLSSRLIAELLLTCLLSWNVAGSGGCVNGRSFSYSLARSYTLLWLMPYTTRTNLVPSALSLTWITLLSKPILLRLLKLLHDNSNIEVLHVRINIFRVAIERSHGLHQALLVHWWLEVTASHVL